ITGCKARIKVDLHHVSGRYDITKFVSKHNHQMIPKHYKHLTKKQRMMTQVEKMFVVKASTMKLGVTTAYNLYSRMKGGAQYVHGTSDDFKNHITDVNAFIGESDAQMLINIMENRKKFVPNFTFQYKVENSELVAMFWTDEVDKCNYKELGDIISFDATFRTNKYDMVFVPFTRIDNHRKRVTKQKQIWRKNETIEILINEANYMVDECLFLLSKDEGVLATFVEQLKTIKQEFQVQVPEPPSRKTSDVIEDIYVVEKLQQNDVNNPQRARNKDGRRGERRKSGREIVLKAKTKQIRKCLCCGEKTNKHTKSTCPSNPKCVAKLARLVAAVAAKQGTTTAAATEQAMTTATVAEQGETTAAAINEATTTTIVFEEATNASRNILLCLDLRFSYDTLFRFWFYL
nr:hypothetical protein [Tanacetum cinerariifolium]